MNKKYNILICPLEWGLGHAGRMIPLASRLHDMGHNILIGAGEKHLSFFRNEVPGLTLINFPGFNPVYSRFLPQYIVLLFRIPALICHIIREHSGLKKIIRDYSIDIVISDNRFGLWNKNIRTVYVTHMPLIPFPRAFAFLEFTGVLLHRAVIRRYSLCFIPDLPGSVNISGRLAHTGRLPGNTRFIGILSRFMDLSSSGSEDHSSFRHNTVIISGPSPQSEILRKKLTDIFIDMEPPTIILGGKPGIKQDELRSGNIIYYNHLPSSAMMQVIKGSDHLVARAGYTTIMELISLNCSALLIPTPGQTEQEYLVRYLTEKGWFTSISQKKISDYLPLSPPVPQWSGEIISMSRTLLGKALEEMLE